MNAMTPEPATPAAFVPVAFVKAPMREDAARADLYALLSRLFYTGPDEALLRAIPAAQALIEAADTAAAESELSKTWTALCDAAKTADATAATLEYDQIFVGTGKAPISIYASHYLTGSFKEQTLVNLRDELQRVGLQRRGGATEPEDHLAGLLDVMRHLIMRGDSDENVAAQTSFFNSYLKPWYATFAVDVMKMPSASFYRLVAAFMKSYFDIEVESFDWTV